MDKRSDRSQGPGEDVPRAVRALDGVSLAVDAAPCSACSGPNGAGKSTTVKILTTLSRPDAGEARWPGIDVMRRPARVRRLDRLRGAEVRASTWTPPDARTYAAGPRVRHERPRARSGARRTARALRPRRGGTAHRAHLLRRHAAQARRGRGARAPAAGAVPGRADHRSRSRGARRHVGRDRAPRRRRGPHHPAHHALPRGGRQAGPAAGDRRPGQVVAEGAPDELKGELHGDAMPSSCASRRGRRGGARRWRAWPRCATWRRDGRALRARADSGARAVPAVLRRSRPAACRGLGHRVAALARRRLSAVHRPRLRGGRRGHGGTR